MVYLVLLEQLTRRKLFLFLICLIIIQIIYFLIGGLVGLFEKIRFYIKCNLDILATKPTHATNHEFTLCQSRLHNRWVYHNPNGNCREDHLEFGSVCDILTTNFYFSFFRQQKSWKDFVYVIQLPRITRWFQTLTSIIVPHIEYDPRVNLSESVGFLVRISKLVVRCECDFNL